MSSESRSRAAIPDWSLSLKNMTDFTGPWSWRWYMMKAVSSPMVRAPWAVIQPPTRSSAPMP